MFQSAWIWELLTPVTPMLQSSRTLSTSTLLSSNPGVYRVYPPLEVIPVPESQHFSTPPLSLGTFTPILLSVIINRIL